MVEERGRRRSRGPREVVSRVLLLVVLVVVGVVTGRLVALLLDDPVAGSAPPGPPAAVSRSPGGQRQDLPPAGQSVRRAVAVLRAWDADRAAAYARGDPAALRRLYLPGSRAGAGDLDVLRAYVDRGLVVRGLRTQVLALRVLATGRGRLTLEVTDRLVGGRAVAGTGRREEGVGLPRDAPTTRVLELRRRAGEWRLGSVQAA